MSTKRLSGGIVLLLVGAGILFGCATLGGSQENIRFSIKRGQPPKFAKDFKGANYVLTRFVLKGDSIDNWSEAIEQMNIRKKDYPPTPEGAYKSLLEMRKKRCPDSTSNIIKQDESSILFETMTANCSPYPDEHSLTRAVYGKESVWVLIYTNKVKALPPELRQDWVENLSSARIVTATGR